MTHHALESGRVAVITGAASGIGLAVAKHLAGLGMKVCLADVDLDNLTPAREAVQALALGGASDVMAQKCDVSRREDIEDLRDGVLKRFGEVALLMNNAATRTGGGALDAVDNWQQSLAVNLWGPIHGVQTFLPLMLKQPAPSLIVNTGSKQGITNPPGNSAYNMTKAALKSYTESLQHELRGLPDCPVSAHLLIPGWTTTGDRPHAPGAWLPEQVADFMIDALSRGDFYILCPDNDVSPAMDHHRIRWAAEDIAQNRPPLSRWHPDYQAAFQADAANDGGKT